MDVGALTSEGTSLLTPQGAPKDIDEWIHAGKRSERGKCKKCMKGARAGTKVGEWKCIQCKEIKNKIEFEAWNKWHGEQQEEQANLRKKAYAEVLVLPDRREEPNMGTERKRKRSVVLVPLYLAQPQLSARDS